MWSFGHDLRFALRALVKAPAYAVWILLIVGTGIGANAAVFAVLNRVVIRPLPYASPERLVQVWEDFSAFGTPKNRISPGTFLRLATPGDLIQRACRHGVRPAWIR